MTSTQANTMPPANAMPPDNIDIDALTRKIEADGTAFHQDMLWTIADYAELASHMPGAVSVLRDVRAPEVLRVRAYAAVARRWDDIRAAVAARRSFDQAFAQLADHWANHQDLRRTSDVPTLAQSGEQLALLRAQARERAACRP